MKFGTREIKDLSDDELRDAIHSVVGIDKNRLDKLDNPRKRHAKLFEKHPPIENPTFTNLAIALNNEFKNRKMTNV